MYISIYMHAYIYTYIYIYEFICIIYICIIYMYIHIYICICIYICVHIYVYVYMYIYIHTRRQWPFETAEKRTGLESWLRCGEVRRPAAALHIASGLHAAVRYLLRSGTRASVLKTSRFFGGVLDQRQKRNLRPQPRTHAGGAIIGIVA